jgi:hypothetical protein
MGSIPDLTHTYTHNTHILRLYVGRSSTSIRRRLPTVNFQPKYDHCTSIWNAQIKPTLVERHMDVEKKRLYFGRISTLITVFLIYAQNETDVGRTSYGRRKEKVIFWSHFDVYKNINYSHVLRVIFIIYVTKIMETLVQRYMNVEKKKVIFWSYFDVCITFV